MPIEAAAGTVVAFHPSGSAALPYGRWSRGGGGRLICADGAICADHVGAQVRTLLFGVAFHGKPINIKHVVALIRQGSG